MLELFCTSYVHVVVRHETRVWRQVFYLSTFHHIKKSLKESARWNIQKSTIQFRKAEDVHFSPFPRGKKWSSRQHNLRSMSSTHNIQIPLSVN